MADQEPNTIDQQFYIAAITRPEVLDSPGRRKWYKGLMDFTTHFWPEAQRSEGFVRDYNDICRQLNHAFDTLSGEDLNAAVFPLLSRWAIACSNLYSQMGLKLRSRSGGLLHEKPAVMD